jgi:hypothetical protein
MRNRPPLHEWERERTIPRGGRPPSRRRARRARRKPPPPPAAPAPVARAASGTGATRTQPCRGRRGASGIRRVTGPPVPGAPGASPYRQRLLTAFRPRAIPSGCPPSDVRRPWLTLREPRISDCTRPSIWRIAETAPRMRWRQGCHGLSCGGRDEYTRSHDDREARTRRNPPPLLHILQPGVVLESHATAQDALSRSPATG